MSKSIEEKIMFNISNKELLINQVKIKILKITRNQEVILKLVGSLNKTYLKELIDMISNNTF
jgi:hypothetical protein